MDEVFESWLPIEGFPGFEVSDLGRVRSVNRKKPRILMASLNEYDQRTVRLTVDGKVRNRIIARLVLGTFERSPMQGERPGFKDGDTDNAELSNLEWE